MPITRPWKIVGATAAIAGLGIAGASSGGIDLQDRADPVQLTAIPAALADTPAHTDDSPESADSPTASAAESADSPNGSPGDPGWVDPSPDEPRHHAAPLRPQPGLSPSGRAAARHG